MGRWKILSSVVANIPKMQSALNFFVNAILIHYIPKYLNPIIVSVSVVVFIFDVVNWKEMGEGSVLDFVIEA